MRRFAAAALLGAALASTAGAAIVFDQPVERKQLGGGPGGMDDRYVRSGHAFTRVPAFLLSGLSTLTGFQGIGDDFLIYTGPLTGAACTGGWQVADTGTGVVGSGIPGTPDTSGYGFLSVGSGASDDDCTIIMLCGEAMKYVVGKQMWAFARVKLSDADDMEAFWGLAASSAVAVDTAAEFLGVDDGIYFEKAETATAFDFHARKNDASSELTAVTATLADATYRIMGFSVSSAGAITVYDGTTWEDLAVVGTIAAGTANIPNDVALTLYFGNQSGAAAQSDTIVVDWYVIGQER